jgi:hypothetical protein
MVGWDSNLTVSNSPASFLTFTVPQASQVDNPLSDNQAKGDLGNSNLTLVQPPVFSC